MQLNLKSFNSNTAMKTRNIKADTFSANNDEDLTLCVELIGKNQFGKRRVSSGTDSVLTECGTPSE